MSATRTCWSQVATLVTVAMMLNPAAAEDWPHWRGPTGMGHSDAKNLPLTWGGKSNDGVVWKSPLLATDEKVRLDNNQSSPIVVGDQVLLVVSAADVVSTADCENVTSVFAGFQSTRAWMTTVSPGRSRTFVGLMDT